MFELEALIAETKLDSQADDPLLWFRWPSENHRQIPRSLHAENETYVRAPQQAGKTLAGAALCVAWAQGREELDGESLTMLGTPNVGALLVHSYKLASESSIKALLEMLGNWDFKPESGSQGTTLAFRIRPKTSRSKDPKKWSRLMILTEEGPLPSGLRLDYVWADEPPKWRYWEELRGRGKRNRPLLRLITATPIERVRWEPLRREFTGKGFPGKDGLSEVRLKLEDNRFLGPAHIANLKRMWVNDEHMEAKLNGDYVDNAGLCPFESTKAMRDGLKLWESNCTEGEPWKDFPDLKVWFPPESGEEYFVLCDLSAGMQDRKKEHDPCAIVVISRQRPRLCAAYTGYLPPQKTGELAVKIAMEWNEGMVVHENNGGWGLSFLHGVGDYGNLYVDLRGDRVTGQVSNRIGWTTTATSRGTLIGSLQQAISENGIEVRSLEVVEQLRTVIVGPDGKIVAAPGYHDEYMIVMGLGAHLLETLPVWKPRKKREEMTQRELLAHEMGQVEKDHDPFSGW